MTKKISIAIDGPAGAGKSTIARAIAGEMGFYYVDTGAIYRTVAYFMDLLGISPKDTDGVERYIDELTIEIEYDEDGLQHMIMNGMDVTGDIRTQDISQKASLISAHAVVRDMLLDMQRDVAKKHNVIMDGRDIGTVVLPRADVKIFLTASAEVRARRRHLELQAKGSKESFEKVLADIKGMAEAGAVAFSEDGKSVMNSALYAQGLKLAAEAGVPVFEMGQINPVTIAKEAVKHAKDYGNDVVLLDTAGRLHIDEELMDELKAIKAETSPNEIMLVVDAMTGQDAVNVAESFNNLLDITGVILTKLDGDTRGGAALSVRYVTGKPIKFIGVGEKIDNIEPFHPDRMASRILGMGDVLSLIEKAEQQFDEKKAAELEKKFLESSFTLDDYLDQFRQIKNMGSMEQLLGMMPGVKPSQLKDAKIDEKQMAHMEAIILSMTPKERAKPDIINSSRKKRIAAGSGRTVEEVNRLLKQYEQVNKLMKQMAKQQTGKGSKKMRFGNFGF